MGSESLIISMVPDGHNTGILQAFANGQWTSVYPPHWMSSMLHNILFCVHYTYIMFFLFYFK